MLARTATELNASAIAQHGTQTFSFFKHNGLWHMKLPGSQGKTSQYDGSALVLSDEEWLHLLAGRHTSITLLLDTEPFEGAQVLNLEELCTGPQGGAFYRMYAYGNKALNRRIWICDLSLCIFGDMPPRIYFRRQVKDSQN